MSENAVNLFDMDADDSTLNVFDKKSTGKDGIFRPQPKDAKDKNEGYKATIRFLPNVLEDGTIGQSAIENHVHYANLPEWNDEKEKNIITNASAQKKVMTFLSEKDVNLEDHAPKRWTEEDKVKVERIVDILSGNDVSSAKTHVNNATTSATSESLVDSDLDSGDDLDEFFGGVDE
jgi:hypothetical protein